MRSNQNFWWIIQFVVSKNLSRFCWKLWNSRQKVEEKLFLKSFSLEKFFLLFKTGYHSRKKAELDKIETVFFLSHNDKNLTRTSLKDGTKALRNKNKTAWKSAAVESFYLEIKRDFPGENEVFLFLVHYEKLCKWKVENKRIVVVTESIIHSLKNEAASTPRTVKRNGNVFKAKGKSSRS